jgi:hypothetical protein
VPAEAAAHQTLSGYRTHLYLDLFSSQPVSAYGITGFMWADLHERAEFAIRRRGDFTRRRSSQGVLSDGIVGEGPP